MTPTPRQRTARAEPSLHGARVALAGKLASMTRREAWRIVRQAGGEPISVITRRTSLLVVGMRGWPLLSDGKVSDTIRRAEQLNRGQAAIRLVNEAEFLSLAGVPQRLDSISRTYPPEVIARLFNVTVEHLDEWARMKLLTPRDDGIELQDIVTLHTLAQLIDRRVSPLTIASSLRRLGEILPGAERALAQLQRLAGSSFEAVNAASEIQPTQDGQLHLGFDEFGRREELDFDREPGEAGEILIRFDPHRLSQRVAGWNEATAAEWFELGQSLEDEERYPEAADAYRKAIALDSRLPEAFFNLGTILHNAGKQDAAIELYRLAVAQDPGLACAWYNLADLLDEQGELNEAITCLEASLKGRSGYADAHYNLALLCEKAGRPRAAREHWEAYLRLDRSSAWAEVARGRLAALAS